MGRRLILPETSVSRAVHLTHVREFGLHIWALEVHGGGASMEAALTVCARGLPWAMLRCRRREHDPFEESVFSRVDSYLQLARRCIDEWRTRVLLSRTDRHCMIWTRWPLSTNYEVWIMRRAG